MTMKIGILRAVLRTWRGLKNATTAFFNRLLGRPAELREAGPTFVEPAFTQDGESHPVF